MQSLEFWKAVVADKANFLESLLSLLADRRIGYCVIGGVAVNAYAAPVVTEDLDLIVPLDQIGTAESLLSERFTTRRFPHRINVSTPGSNLRVQIQTDPRFAGFLGRASARQVLGLTLPVACVEDLLESKIWAALEAERRPSKRQKDLADILRLIELRPDLRGRVPAEILGRLF